MKITTNSKKHSQLWLYFILVVFSLLSLTAIIMAAIAVGLFHLGQIGPDKGHPLAPIVALLFISVIVGTFLSIFVGRIILQPITRFSEALNEVSKGNFDVHLEDDSNVKELKKMVHDFNIMTQELSSIETLRNDFIINVSHEFKTPLAAIEGYATLLQDNNLATDEKDEYTSMIIDASQQLSTLTGNILQLSKLESNEIILERNHFRIDEQIRQVILFLETAWSSKNIDFRLELPSITYYGNERLLRQVWMNIVGNAIKFTPDDGTISILLETKAQNIIITILDTGQGMSTDIQKRIFDKFFQGDNTRNTQGNGLGLTLAKRIVDLSGGTITFTSKLNKGTTFFITLPIEQ